MHPLSEGFPEHRMLQIDAFDHLGSAEQWTALLWSVLRKLYYASDALLLSPGSLFSLYSLASAFGVAVVFLTTRRRARGRCIGWRVVARGLFPNWLLRSASSRADLGFLVLNLFATGTLIGWALISYPFVGHGVRAGLTSVLGSRAPIGLDDHIAAMIVTLVGFVAYEFSYWLDHYLSHKVPFLWEFHRVHHTAETLSPLTVFRVHPVDSLVFANITGLVMGSAMGTTEYLLGAHMSGFQVAGNNIILLGFVFVTLHLQHSHVWIAFTGPLGRVFASPAHHQIHHSADPDHFGKNLGNCTVVFDWLFGTLRIPARAREPLVFGVEPGACSPHTVMGGLIKPFAQAIESLGPVSRMRFRLLGSRP